MKPQSRKLLALWVAALAGGGCASTALTVNLDLYRDDARSLVVELTPVRVAQLTTALATAGPEVDSLAKDRADLADTKELPGADLSCTSAAGYGGCQILAEAIRRAGSLDSEKLREAILGMDDNTVFGGFRVEGLRTTVSADPTRP